MNPDAYTYKERRMLARKIKREFIAGLSKIFLRYANENYLGLKLKVPTIHGLTNGGYFVPAEMWMSDCLRAFVQTKTGCIVDVGANVGILLVKLRVFSAETAYYGIEPNPACCFYLHELIRLNQFKNAQVFPLALENTTGIMEFYASKIGDEGGSLFKSYKENDPRTYSFKTFVMEGDRFVATLRLSEPIAAIKIDVEGAELTVLRGLQETVKRYRPYIYCEIQHTRDIEQERRATELCETLDDMGYSVLGVDEETHTFGIIEDFRKVGKAYKDEYVFSPQEDLGRLLSSVRSTDPNFVKTVLRPPT